ncbi:MAG: hypothetical protein J6T72_02520, partial [Alphaproteobacteria bacterium]|nr:hypothetical protein [Alphaproteobacteria bacterium]
KKLQSKNKQEHIQNLRKSLQTLCHANPKGNPKEEIQNLRLLQLIYRELYPSAKKLPEELRFENLSYRDFEPIKDTSITALSELPTTKKDKQKEKLRKRRKKEKLEELREKYKDSKEKYEEIEKEFKKSDEYKPLPSEEISPCAKIIRSNARRLVNSEHFTQIILQSTRKTQTQSR